MKFELTEEQLKNLLIFLLRADLKGQEVNAYNDIMKVFSNPIKEENGDK
jgi:hypothetical protein